MPSFASSSLLLALLLVPTTTAQNLRAAAAGIPIINEETTGRRRLQQVSVVDPNAITNQVIMASEHDPRTVEYKTTGETETDGSTIPKNPRKFISYTSSPWEQIWLDNIDSWEKNETICEIMHTPEHTKYMHDFLSSTCTNGFKPPHSNWCMIDDEIHPLYFNKARHGRIEYYWEAREYRNSFWTGPPLLLESNRIPTKVINPPANMEHVFSKFVFLDETTGEEYTEYIEPLVSHLRFPLSKCGRESKKHRWYDLAYYRGLEYRGYVIPPAGVRNKRKLYFDAGASNWSKDKDHGSSLQYFYKMWKRQGIAWDHIFAYEMSTTPTDFFETVPEEHRDLITYQQCAVTSTPEEDDSDKHPFLPYEIQRKANPEDYVLFKLDIDSHLVEANTIEHILNDPNNFIDEIAFEHHVSGNYLMRREWGDIGGDVAKSMRESYELFLRMRMKGIRAHSWI
mmetsp:Transcript_3956/g.5709  ORF Transcript_3956/g.5709 Transcript_3956/m.5709 type:complete len:453 (-) Transcript_3956:75-1433(-)